MPRPELELATVHEIARGLCASLDIRHSFDAALRVLAVQLAYPRLMLVLADESRHQLAVHSAVGLGAAQQALGRWVVDAPDADADTRDLVQQVFVSGRPSIWPDGRSAPPAADPTGEFGPPLAEGSTLLAVPLQAGSDTLGVLIARRDEAPGDTTATTTAATTAATTADSSPADDQRLLQLVAALLAQALQLHRAVSAEAQRWQQEGTRLRKALQRQRGASYSLDAIIGDSAPMQRLFAEVHQAAPSRATVLLRGESGTGKEALARALHGLSTCSQGPFVAVNCAAIAETLLESELFGHERGAFTGAAVDRKGRFEQAHGGTLFLDEIGDISPAFQAKLLRVLQEREFERVGGSRTVKVDVRLIGATNRDLESMVRRGEFRADLYYRINVIAIFVPPLRERRADIPALVAHFLAQHNAEYQRRLRVTPEALQVLQHCAWPGNVRELQNCIERTAVLAPHDTLKPQDIACQRDRCLTHTLHRVDTAAPAPARAPATAPAPAPADSARSAASADSAEAAEAARTDIQRERLLQVMEQCAWVQAKAARMLRITPRQLQYALQRHRIAVRKL